jgi:hypothetical protein
MIGPSVTQSVQAKLDVVNRDYLAQTRLDTAIQLMRDVLDYGQACRVGDQDQVRTTFSTVLKSITAVQHDGRVS